MGGGKFYCSTVIDIEHTLATIVFEFLAMPCRVLEVIAAII